MELPWFGQAGVLFHYKLSQKKRSRPLARREAMKKRNIYVICEHFEAPHNAARGC